jgi:hypothetical protein
MQDLEKLDSSIEELRSAMRSAGIPDQHTAVKPLLEDDSFFDRPTKPIDLQLPLPELLASLPDEASPLPLNGLTLRQLFDTHLPDDPSGCIISAIVFGLSAYVLKQTLLGEFYMLFSVGAAMTAGYSLFLKIRKRALWRKFILRIESQFESMHGLSDFESELQHPIYVGERLIITKSWIFEPYRLGYDGLIHLDTLTDVYLYIQLHPNRTDRYEFAEVGLIAPRLQANINLTPETRSRFGQLISHHRTQHDPQPELPASETVYEGEVVSE